MKSTPNDLPLIVCVPVSFKAIMDENYSVYEQVACPECGEDMWLGMRSKILRDQGKGFAVCGYCAIRVYGLRKNEADNMELLTDKDS